MPSICYNHYATLIKSVASRTDETVVLGEGNVHPIIPYFSPISLPHEWNQEYKSLSIEDNPIEPRRLSIGTSTSGQQVIRLSRSTSSGTSTSRSVSRSATMKIPTEKCKHQGSQINCMQCKQQILDVRRQQQKHHQNHQIDDHVHITSFESTSRPVSDCKYCIESNELELHMIRPSLPREPEISLKKLNDRGLPPSNTKLTLEDKNLTVEMQFLAYKKDQENLSMEHKQLNYVNYQIACLHQNIDDIARDVLSVKSHLTTLHSEKD
jgi:hypothetical protein